nr:hypothetical protein [Candidatus Sigynarchaeota archaeon]
MAMLNDFKLLLAKLKEMLLSHPEEPVFLEEVSRVLGVSIEEAELLHDIISEIFSWTYDVEIDREIRGKYMLYEPDEDGLDEGLEEEME